MYHVTVYTNHILYDSDVMVQMVMMLKNACEINGFGMY